ncbi:MAG: beta-glucosidase [Spirochaetaceae bacterium]|nr:MAG: beta-glucosidase [Spirochaetaceae bacterium]
MLTFPPDFRWGVSTAAYAIEGAWNQDGKGESIWDRFAHQGGNIKDGSTGDMACDHYNRMSEDVELMAEVGINTYRFSVSWPRIFPAGTGKANAKGLDFYSRLIDILLESGIEPFVVLYQWDLPQALQDSGGWENQNSPRWFTDYARTLYRELGDRVRLWITHNEPFVPSLLAYHEGEHPPAVRDLRRALEVSKQILLSHGLAVQAFREENIRGKIGLSTIFFPVHAAGDRPEDLEARQRYDGYFHRWFLDPLFRGSFPEDMLDWYGKKGTVFPQLDSLEASIVAQPIDFLGVCYFSRFVVKHAEGSLLEVEMVEPQSEKANDMGWEIYPEGIYEVLKRVHDEYTPPEIYISENGIPLADRIEEDGTIRDGERIAFLSGCLSYVHQAIDEGIPVRGYSVWSLMDNLEWDLGLSKRFGLAYVDYQTLRRIPKASFRWYSGVVSTGELEQGDDL